MKRILAIVFSAVLLCSFAACTAAPEADIDAPADDAAESIDAELIYAPIIEKYSRAFEEKWDIEKLLGEGMSGGLDYFINSGDETVGTAGYFIGDVNADSVPELLIGIVPDSTAPDKTVLDLYTVVDGAPVHVFSSFERSAYYVTSDGTVVNTGSSSAFLSVVLFCNIADGQLSVFDGILYDYLANESEPAFRVSGEEWDSSQGEHISNAEAEAIVGEYEANYIQPEYIPF